MMRYGFPDEYIASQPWKIHFAGWETDTFRLQQAGWQLSAIQSHAYNGIQIGFEHPQYRVRGLTRPVDTYRARSRMSQYGSMFLDQEMIQTEAYLASDFTMMATSVAPFSAYEPIDAQPQLIRVNELMSKNMVFAPNLARTQELIVPEQSVDDLLSMIIDKQAASRAELIRKRVREHGGDVDFTPRTHVHAQIVSIG